MRLRGWLVVAAVALVAAAFAWANRYERVTVDFGPFSVHAVPLPIFFFAAVLLGMAAMFFVSLPYDRRVRDLLASHGLLDAATRPAAQVPGPRPLFDPLAPSADPHLPVADAAGEADGRSAAAEIDPRTTGFPLPNAADRDAGMESTHAVDGRELE